jgi:hypothetical protein
MNGTIMTAHETIKQAIEQYIDKAGVSQVLELVGEICSEKAQHISETWQDESLAKAWDKAAQVCFAASWKNEVTQIS